MSLKVFRSKSSGANGPNVSVVCSITEYTYTGEYLGSRSVSATLSMPTENFFKVGDFVIFRNEIFKLYELPVTSKQASSGYAQDAFTYECSFRSADSELENVRFLDYIAEDNGSITYSNYNKPAVFGDLTQHTDRIKHNLKRVYNDRWRCSISGASIKDSVKIEYSEDNVLTALAKIAKEMKCFVYVYGDLISDWDYDDTAIGLSYTDNKDRLSIVFVDEAVKLKTPLSYGKGNGLQKISDVGKGDLSLPTRLIAYGNTTNIPIGYNRKGFYSESAYITNLMLPNASIAGIDYIDHKDISEIGVREGIVYFDGSSDKEDIFPTIQGMTAEDLRAAGVEGITKDGALDEVLGFEGLTNDGQGAVIEFTNQQITDISSGVMKFKQLSEEILRTDGDPHVANGRWNFLQKAPLISTKMFSRGLIGNSFGEFVCKKADPRLYELCNTPYDLDLVEREYGKYVRERISYDLEREASVLFASLRGLIGSVGKARSVVEETQKDLRTPIAMIKEILTNDKKFNLSEDQRKVLETGYEIASKASNNLVDGNKLFDSIIDKSVLGLMNISAFFKNIDAASANKRGALPAYGIAGKEQSALYPMEDYKGDQEYAQEIFKVFSNVLDEVTNAYILGFTLDSSFHTIPVEIDHSTDLISQKKAILIRVFKYLESMVEKAAFDVTESSKAVSVLTNAINATGYIYIKPAAIVSYTPSEGLSWSSEGVKRPPYKRMDEDATDIENISRKADQTHKIGGELIGKPDYSAAFVWIPYMGFDLRAAFEKSPEKPQIHMKSGRCAGYTFDVLNCFRDASKFDGAWKVRIDIVDEKTFFIPNKRTDIAAGDKYVLLGIELPEVYVLAAEQRLLKAAHTMLTKLWNDKTPSSISMNSIFAAENPSICNKLYEGFRIRVYDTELDIDQEHLIGKLTIAHKADGLPEYSIDLRKDEDLNISRVDKIKKAIDDVSLGLDDGGWYNKLVESYVEAAINRWSLKLRKETLPKRGDGVVDGSITTTEGFNSTGVSSLNEVLSTRISASESVATDKIDAGFANVKSLNVGDGCFAVDTAGVVRANKMILRDGLEAPMLKYNRVEVSAGERWDSVGGGVVRDVISENGLFIDFESEPDGSVLFAAGDFCKGVRYFENGSFENIYFLLKGKKEISGKAYWECELRPASKKPIVGMSVAVVGNMTDEKRRNAIRYESTPHPRMTIYANLRSWEPSSANVVGVFGDMSDIGALQGFSEQEVQTSGAYVRDILMTGVIKQRMASSDGYKLVAVYEGHWDETKTYGPQSEVSHLGSLWRAKGAVVGERPEASDKWERIVEKGEDAENLIRMERVIIKGDPNFRNNVGSVTLRNRIFFGNEDVTDFLLSNGIQLEWIRKNPNGVDEDGITDEAWVNAHRGMLEVTYTAKDEINGAIYGCRVINPERIKELLKLNN